VSLLTKSNYISGLQCPRYLWIKVNDKGQLPEICFADENKFKQGRIVGDFAKKLYPDGIDVPINDFMQNINDTKSLLDQRKPLFEAGFLVDKLFSRADILVPAGEDAWDVIEVKSSTKLKDEHISDVAFQKYCYEKSGFKIRKCFLFCLNNQYVKNGDIKVEELFLKNNITKDVNNLETEDNILSLKQIISQPDCPEICIAENCNKPYACPLKEKCWHSLPEDNVFDLYRGGKKSFELFNDGILSIKDIPEDFKLSDKQSIQKEVLVNNETKIDKGEIKKFLNTLEYPLYYLDFETFSTAIPMFDGTRPYQQISFQYSLHIVNENAEVKHISFLYDGNGDPREDFIKSLAENIGSGGSVIVFNKGFEERILKELAESFSDYSEIIECVLNRIVDLLIPFRNFDYYNPSQKGSASIKKVLPAVTGEGYSNMNISKGDEASIKYYQVTYGDNVDLKEKQQVRTDLEAYCKLDTEGMIWIVDKLRGLINYD